MTDVSRQIALEGAPNFRDLGGYATADGRRVRSGQLFRSGVLSDVTDPDIALLTGLQIATVVDLRSRDEIAERPNKLPPGATAVEVPVTDISAAPGTIAARLEAGDTEGLGPEMLLAGNRAFARELRGAFRTMLHLAIDPAHRPIVFHCTAGKDRTGFAAMLVLRTLGVPRETVLTDYLQSNDRLAERHASVVARLQDRIVDLEPLLAMLQVRREYLEAGLDAIDADHGSFDAYLRVALDVTDEQRARFQDDLLEPAGR
jgi:protein-tyrosine phosphatase